MLGNDTAGPAKQFPFMLKMVIFADHRSEVIMPSSLTDSGWHAVPPQRYIPYRLFTAERSTHGRSFSYPYRGRVYGPGTRV